MRNIIKFLFNSLKKIKKPIILKDKRNKLNPVNDERIKSQVKIKQAHNNFNNFFNTINDLLFVLDTEGKIIDINNTVYKRLGYEKEELIGKSVLLVHPENRREEAGKTVANMLSGKKDFCPIPVITKHGITIPVETHIVIGEWNGEPALFGVVKDISELKKSEEKFSKAFHSNATLMAISTVEDGCYIDVNDTFLKTLGFERDEVIGKKSYDLDLITDKEQREKIKKEFEKNGKVQNVEVLIKGKNGLMHNGIFSVDSIDFDLSGRLPCWLTTMIDITEQKAIERKLLMKESMLKAIAKATNELLANSDTVSAISNSLTIIGKGAGVDRVYFFKNNYNQENLIFTTSHKFEWNSNFAEPQIDNPELQNILFDEIAEYIKPLSKGLPFIGIVRNLEYSKTKKILEEQKILSTIGLPIFVENEFWGFVGFDQCEYERIWIEDELALLMSFVNSIIGAINRNNFEDKIEFLSYHDQLTGLYNRRFYEEELKRLDTERNLPMTIVMGDVNGLKLINDSFGHVMGDELIKKVAEVITRGCRADDIIARLGGDEFVILLPKTDAFETEQIIKRINDISLKEKVGSIDISISFGYETKNDKGEKIQDIFKSAEDHMYKKKLFESQSMRGKIIEAIINTLHEKNKREEQHSHRVSALCKNMGEALGMPEHKIKELKSVGLLHDIGKTAIDENVLNKSGKLTDNEWKEIKHHPEIGYRILNTVNYMSDMAKYVLYHHERWDGKGYPKGLKGEEIPFVSRIITIADAYDAMTSDRSYRNALPCEVAIAELQKNSGVQFDSELVSVFIEKVLR